MSDLPTGFQGFTFSPPPLSLNGQNVAGGLNFSASNAVSQVDQASQAYSFINNLNSQVLGFAGNTFAGVQSFAEPSFSAIINGLTGTAGNAVSGLTAIGQGAVGAENTAAKNLCSGFLGCLF